MIKPYIKEAESSHLETILNLNKELFNAESIYIDSFNENWSKSEFARRYFQNRIADPLSIVFIAAIESEVVGYISGYVYSNSTRIPPTSAEIENIIVLDKYRGRGIGKILSDKFEQKAKTLGASRLKVVALTKNIPAINFYKKFGFDDHEVLLEKQL